MYHSRPEKNSYLVQCGSCNLLRFGFKILFTRHWTNFEWIVFYFLYNSSIKVIAFVMVDVKMHLANTLNLECWFLLLFFFFSLWLKWIVLVLGVSVLVFVCSWQIPRKVNSLCWKKNNFNFIVRQVTIEFDVVISLFIFSHSSVCFATCLRLIFLVFFFENQLEVIY